VPTADGGVYVVRHLEEQPLPAGVECLDGGTGSLQLLEPMQEAGRVVLVDATLDENPPGSVRRLRPRFSKDYPPTLTAHDIGLKDLLDALYLLGGPPPVTLYAVTIEFPQPMGLGLGPELSAVVPEVARRVVRDVA
jgi:hydrogenase maturation protease